MEILRFAQDDSAQVVTRGRSGDSRHAFSMLKKNRRIATSSLSPPPKKIVSS
jgi:hypothetical protein